ncbi:unnamed protein product [Ectocarpus sp. CCAP 1310/34]|nr:unnamed protein product [Ectocarpus sp. CCAP 1310/34]
MRDHFRTVKNNIDANIILHSGGVAAPRGGSGKFPYSSPLILPKCATMQNTSDGWNPKGPRRVFMEEDVGYIIGFRYKCERCVEYNGTVEESEQRPTSFNAWDVGCLDRLPDYVSKENAGGLFAPRAPALGRNRVYSNKLQFPSRRRWFTR